MHSDNGQWYPTPLVVPCVHTMNVIMQCPAGSWPRARVFLVHFYVLAINVLFVFMSRVFLTCSDGACTRQAFYNPK